MDADTMRHADGRLRNYAELARVRRDECACGRTWDAVAPKERFVMRDTIFGNVYRWRCWECAEKDHERMQARRMG